MQLRQIQSVFLGQIPFGVIAACLLAVIVMAQPGPGISELRRISISECELNGFGLGGTADEMLEALGEPDRASLAILTGNEYPHLEYQYDGLRIVFSMHGRSVLSYFVTSGEYRFQSGVGVGSTRQEIKSALGPAIEGRAGDTEYMGYQVTGNDGRRLPAQLMFKLDRDVAVEFFVETY